MWTVIQGAKFLRRLNGWMAIFWIAMIPVSIALGWVESVVYVSALSLWALVSGHWSAWQGARVEAKDDVEEQRRTESLASGRWRESARRRTTVPGRVLRERRAAVRKR